VAPPWPLGDRPIAELRRSPHPDLARLTIGDIVHHYENLILALPERPIIMGHSYGGLFTQLLLDADLGRRASRWSQCRSAVSSQDQGRCFRGFRSTWLWRGWSRVLTMSFAQFAANFAQTLPEYQMRAAYDRYVVPTPAVSTTSVRSASAQVSWPKTLAGCPASDRRRERPNHRTVRRLGHLQKAAVRPLSHSFQVIPGRSHFLIVEPGWEEVADVVLQWASEPRRN
jgi:pimeloyl-ACP methyl ester carboxylesterase